jgi:hypothetical protein
MEDRVTASEIARWLASGRATVRRGRIVLRESPPRDLEPEEEEPPRRAPRWARIIGAVLGWWVIAVLVLLHILV